MQMVTALVEQPKKKKEKHSNWWCEKDFKIGDPVRHPVHGEGTVTNVWGAYKFCRVCFRELDWEKPICKKHPDDAPQCSPDSNGTYDVRFVTGRAGSFNEKFLTRVCPPRKK